MTVHRQRPNLIYERGLPSFRRLEYRPYDGRAKIFERLADKTDLTSVQLLRFLVKYREGGSQMSSSHKSLAGSYFYCIACERYWSVEWWVRFPGPCPDHCRHLIHVSSRTIYQIQTPVSRLSTALHGYTIGWGRSSFLYTMTYVGAQMILDSECFFYYKDIGA